MNFDGGELIKAFRKESGMTLRQMSKKTGINAVMLNKYELGQTMPRFDKVQWVLEACGYELEVKKIDEKPRKNAVKERGFINEIVKYIFEYPDDDYMTMECLCRKLYKYGLIGWHDGHWMPLKKETDHE